MNRQHPRVLIVEDEPTIAHYLGKIFGLWYWDVTSADSVAEAFRELKQVPLGFDLVVLDLMLPDGKGTEVLKYVRANTGRTKIVVTTAKTIHDVQDVIDLKPDQLFFKPFNFEPLQAFAAGIYEAFRPASGTA